MEEMHFDFEIIGIFKILLNGERVCAQFTVKNQAASAVKKLIGIEIAYVISAV
jgi:hypothetical protein